MNRDRSSIRRRRGPLSPAVLYLLAAIVGTAAIGFVVFYAALAAENNNWQRTLHLAVSRAVALTIVLFTLAALYGLHRLLLLLVDRFLLQWVISFRRGQHEPEPSSSPETPVYSLSVLCRRFRRYAVYSLMGLTVGTALGIAVFCLGVVCWEYAFSSSSPARSGGDPIDAWADGIVRFVLMIITASPFAATGLVAGERVARAIGGDRRGTA